MNSHHIYRRLEAFLVSSMDRMASCSILAFLRELPATKNQKNSIKTKNCCKLIRMLQEGKCGRRAWCGDGECRRRRCAASIRVRRIQNNSMKSKIFASKSIGTRISGHLRCSMRNIANNSIKTNIYTSASNAPSSARPPPSIQRHRIGSMWFLFPVF